MSDIRNQLIKDSYNYVLQSDLSTGVVYRIGGDIPVNPIFQSGLTINSGFTYSNGTEQLGYVMTCDAFGNANWAPASAATPSSGVTSITVGNGLSANSSTGAVTIVFTGSTSFSGDYLPLSGGTITGNLIINSGLTATTISATTYYSLPVSAVTNGDGISTSTSGGVVTITNTRPQGITGITATDGLSGDTTNFATIIINTDKGSSQNIFKNIQIGGVTQFGANSNNSDLNFSGINITITSAATNTLVFSAATGGGGGISGGGTTNYIPKFTGSTGIGNSQLQDDGSQVFTNQGYGSPLTGNLSINASGTTGIAGRATQYGVYGTISGATAGASAVYGEAGTGQYGIQGKGIGDVQIVVGVYGVATPDTGSGSGTLIGGRFSAGTTDEGARYSLWLQDGTEVAGRYLQCATSDGKASWADFGYGFSFGGVSLTSTQVFATTTTTINAATYIDINGCSVTLAAGTWLITGHVVIAAANAIVQGFVAITTAANTVVAASALSRPASGTPSLNSPFAVSWSVLVSPSTTTTYKLRAARGLTTHTLTYTVYNGTGFNTASHANDGSNLGTNILAIRIS